MHGGDIYSNDIDIDLSVNLNPYQTKESLGSKICDAVKEASSHAGCYPDISQSAVRSAIAKSENISAKCIWAGNGASELIMAITLMVKPECAILTEPAFSGYAHALSAVGVNMIKRHMLSVADDFLLTDKVLSDMTDDIDIMFLCDPNSPTGRNINEDLLIRILDKAKLCGITVVIDESFMQLSDKYLLLCDSGKWEDRTARLIREYENIFIVRSYTKSFALPGIRMGFVLSCADNIRKLCGYLPEWNLGTVSEYVMRRCADIAGDGSFYKDSVRFIQNEREFLSNALRDKGLTVYESNTLFLLVKGPDDLYDRLLAKKILIRKCDDYPGLGKGWYRIAVKTRADNERLLEGL